MGIFQNCPLYVQFSLTTDCLVIFLLGLYEIQKKTKKKKRLLVQNQQCLVSVCPQAITGQKRDRTSGSMSSKGTVWLVNWCNVSFLQILCWVHCADLEKLFSCSFAEVSCDQAALTKKLGDTIRGSCTLHLNINMLNSALLPRI